MESLLYLLVCALVAVNLAWLAFLSVQIRRGLDALGAAQTVERAHREKLQRRWNETIRGIEISALAAIRELGLLSSPARQDAPTS